ncbi:MAG: hypothetical protein ABJA20_12805 [Novosphingobium sp.]
MSMIETFLSFTKRLPSAQMESVDAALAALMDSFSTDYDFTTSELAEIDNRVAEPRPNSLIRPKASPSPHDPPIRSSQIASLYSVCFATKTANGKVARALSYTPKICHPVSRSFPSSAPSFCGYFALVPRGTLSSLRTV